jgi:CubicO group peptidase (beta-lactamase class C family)
MASRFLRTKALAVFAALLAAGSAAAQHRTYTVEDPFNWQESDPRDQGVDPAIIDTALSAGHALPFLHALLVVKDGVLIGEQYYGGAEPTDANTVMSVSKSFLSAIVGLAQREGYLHVDQPIMDFFPDYSGGLDSRKFRITIRQLLTMTAGFPRDEYTTEWSRWLASSDWVRFCLEQPLEADPGEVWNYSTCSTHIASALVTRATGMSTRAFAQRHLFDPLGIQIGGWRRDPDGYYRGGWDMYFTPRDLARFGYLFLSGGKLEGGRVVPRKWARKTTRTNISGRGSWGPLARWGYGYWWWTGNGPEVFKMSFGLGYGGQYVINVPRLKVTVVAMANGDVDPVTADMQERAVLGLIIEDLLRPMRKARISE